MGRTKAPTIRETNPEAESAKDIAQTSLYWFGMLPATGTFKIRRATRDKDQKTGDYYTYVDVTSQELWEGEVNQWVGRCPWKQSLAVNGLSFDAFSEALMRPVGAAGGILDRLPWPGAVMEMDAEKFRHIIRQCYRNVIRVTNGIGHDINLDQPKSYMMLNSGEEKITRESFNPRTDTYFAHYVYVVKTEADPTAYDPTTYYRLAASWDEFFRDPPKSVAEAYPLVGGEVKFQEENK